MSSVILGASPSGLGVGVMVRRNGRKSGSSICLPLDINLGTTGSLSWNVRAVSLFELDLALKNHLVDTDWLEAFSQIDRTIFFDNTWTMSSNWFEVTSPPLPSAWSYGEISCKSFLLAGSFE